MKASEIMIGDWVNVRDSETPKQVKGLKQADVILGTKWFETGTWFVLIDDVWWELRYIKPIPLCRVHLVKNGFKVQDADDALFIYKDNECKISIRFDNSCEGMGLPPVIFMSIEGADFDMNKPVEYVHELQQAMKVLGIEKNIEL